MSVVAASHNPLFAMVGGDLAYANGMVTCYRKWDRVCVRCSIVFFVSFYYSHIRLLVLNQYVELSEPTNMFHIKLLVKWLLNWRTYMVTSFGDYIPFVLAIGNHEG